MDLIRATFGRCDWPLIEDVSFLHAHGLAAFVYAALARANLVQSQPRSHELRLAVMANLATQQRRAPVLAEVLKTLTGLPVIALKGLDYSVRLYGDAALRPMGDHDLLVRAEDYDEALRRLLTIGFRSALKQEGVAALSGHYAEQLVRDQYHLDLHRSLRQTQRANIDYSGIFERSQGAQIFGSPVRFLDPIDRTLLHVYHQAAHEFCVPLITFVDLELMLVRSHELHARAEAFGISRPLKHALYLRDQLFGFAGNDSVSGLLPSIDEVIAQQRPARALQLVRKALLFDSPGALARFAAYARGS